MSGLVEFETAERILQDIGHIPISDSSVWRRTQRWGQQCQAVEAAQRAAAMALPAGHEPIAGEARSQPEMGVAMDGAMVHVRGEGWKELKVGCVFEIEVCPTRDPHTGDEVDLAHAVRTTYVAHLGGPEALGQLVWSEAHRRRWPLARETVALGDGAAWVWNVVKDHFFDSLQVVDWFHATEHLWAAAHLLKGPDTPQARGWFKAHETPLFQGHADQVAADLRQAAADHPDLAEALRREAGYFQDNQRRMHYLDTRQEGFPIGSGMVECGCKQFRARFVGAGMRWSRPCLERLIPIRAAVMSRRFDQVWQAAYQPPPR